LTTPGFSLITLGKKRREHINFFKEEQWAEVRIMNPQKN